MTIYELIQHLTKFDASEQVLVTDGSRRALPVVSVAHGYGLVLIHTDRSRLRSVTARSQPNWGLADAE